MKLRLLTAALAVAGLAASSAASAAVIQYSANINLSIASDQPVLGFVIPLPGLPISINIGDTLEGTITFENNARVVVGNGSVFGDDEFIEGIFHPDLGTTAASTGTFQFLGVQGDFLPSQPIQSFAFGGAIGFSKIANFTDSSFSFTGISFDLTYVDDGQTEPFTSEVTPARINFPMTPAFADGVPEPGTWAFLGLGFFGVGTAVRRRSDRPAETNIA